MGFEAFWRWFDRAARFDFAGNVLGWFWDWKSWALSGTGGVVALILSKLDGWSNTGVFLATLCAGLIVAVAYAVLKWAFSPALPPKIEKSAPATAVSAPSLSPDVDAREAFFQILMESEWAATQRAKPPDPKTSRCDWLEVRLATEIHKALRNSQLASWGEECLPGTATTPEKPIPSDTWDKVEILFDQTSVPRTAAFFKGRASLERGAMVWVAVKFNNAQFFRLFPLSAQSNSNWRPISEAVTHVANRIGETDAEKCWPEARKRLRQAAYDKKLKIRGRKQLANRRATRDGDYADIHTDISNDYWSATELSAMATSQSRPNQTDCHTDPETAYAWGPKGLDERNRYAQLLIDWNDVIKEWP
jgi:hypothetical protein